MEARFVKWAEKRFTSGTYLTWHPNYLRKSNKWLGRCWFLKYGKDEKSWEKNIDKIVPRLHFPESFVQVYTEWGSGRLPRK